MGTKGEESRKMEKTQLANVRKFVVVHIDECIDKVDEFVNAIADYRISEQMIQIVERSNVDDVKGEIRFS